MSKSATFKSTMKLFTPKPSKPLWIYIIIILHGKKIKNQDSQPFVRNTENIHVIRGCCDDEMNEGVCDKNTYYKTHLEYLRELIPSSDTFEDVIHKQYNPTLVDLMWNRPVPTTPSEEVILDVPLLTDKRISLLESPKLRKRTVSRVGKIRNKLLRIKGEEVSDIYFGVHFISSNYPELMETIHGIITRFNDIIKTGAIGRLSIILEALNNELGRICRQYKIPEHHIFMADLSCNGGLSDAEYTEDVVSGAFGKRTRKPLHPKKRSI